MYYTMRLLLLVISGFFTCYGMEVPSAAENGLPKPFCFIRAGDIEGLKQCVHEEPASCNVLLEDEKYTPLIYVFECFGRNLEQSALVHDMVAILLKAGANPNAGFACKPIHYAAGCALLTVVKLLHTHNAEIKALDVHGATALHYVAGADVSFLRCGLKPRKKSSSTILRRTQSPSDLVGPLIADRSEILSRLASRASGEFHAEDTLRTPVAAQLLEWGVSGDILDQEEKTAWDYASRLGLTSVMERLVKKTENTKPE